MRSSFYHGWYVVPREPGGLAQLQRKLSGLLFLIEGKPLVSPSGSVWEIIAMYWWEYICCI